MVSLDERMNLKKAILVSVRRAPKKMTRTVIQKVLYFATMKGVTHTGYQAHFYGPYSSEVASTIQDLASARFLREREETLDATASPWEVRGYKYSLPRNVEEALDSVLSKDDKKDATVLEWVIDTCIKRGSLKPKPISIAAKVLYILHEEGRPLTVSQIEKKANELGWHIVEPEIENSAVGLLSDLKFAAMQSG
jgi:uncharacterized protein YwgA